MPIRGFERVNVLFAAGLCGSALLVSCGGSSDTGIEQATAPAGKSQQHLIEVLSSESHLVSGGSALVRVTLPPGIVKNGVSILANGQDMTGQFKEVEPGALLGVVSGLPVGHSAIAVRATEGKGLAGSLAVRNWPIEGPIISGPHQTPFYCQTQQFKLPDGSTLGAALDENCAVRRSPGNKHMPLGEYRFQAPSFLGSAPATTLGKLSWRPPATPHWQASDHELP